MDKAQHVMLDIETMGTGNFAVIASIGAVKFDPYGDKIDDGFYATVDMDSCAKLGMRFDGGTIAFWLKQPDEARKALLDHTQDIRNVLEGLRDWFGPPSKPVWGNGATFDNVIVRNAFMLAGMDCPWSYKHDWCYRTLKNLAPTDVKPEDFGVAHHALDDATAQALHLQKIVRSLGLIFQ